MVMPPHRNDSERIGTWPSKISTRILWVQTLRCWLSLLVQANSSSISASREHVFTSLFFLKFSFSHKMFYIHWSFRRAESWEHGNHPLPLYSNSHNLYSNCVRECFNPAEHCHLLHLPTDKTNMKVVLKIIIIILKTHNDIDVRKHCLY